MIRIWFDDKGMNIGFVPFSGKAVVARLRFLPYSPYLPIYLFAVLTVVSVVGTVAACIKNIDSLPAMILGGFSLFSLLTTFTLIGIIFGWTYKPYCRDYPERVSEWKAYILKTTHLPKRWYATWENAAGSSQSLKDAIEDALFTRAELSAEFAERYASIATFARVEEVRKHIISTHHIFRSPAAARIPYKSYPSAWMLVFSNLATVETVLHWAALKVDMKQALARKIAGAGDLSILGISNDTDESLLRSLNGDSDVLLLAVY